MDKHQSIKWPADETIIRQRMSCHKNIKRLISKQQPLTLLLIEAYSFYLTNKKA